MRFNGTIKTWNDERGFGFIEPAQGGHEVFVHLKAFKGRHGRPRVGQAVSFEVEVSPEGKKRAKAVETPAPAAPARTRRARNSERPGTGTYFAIPVFMALYAVVAVLWKVPVWVAGLYVGTSVLALLVYAADKSAAAANEWRVSEASLLMIGLVGGWPGAIVAQQVLRHKSSKASFRSAFWGTVLLNVAAFVALSSPMAKTILARGFL